MKIKWAQSLYPHNRQSKITEKEKTEKNSRERF